MMDFLLWLDGDPDRFRVGMGITGTLTLLVAGAAWIRNGGRLAWTRSPALFDALLLLTMLAYRWPALVFNQRMNDPDEGQMMAGALTFLHQPAFWRHIDGTTHGPFAQLPLSLFYAAGFPADYTTTRLVALLLVWGAVVFTWRALAPAIGDGLSRLLILPLGTHVATIEFPGFVQYSSEHAPMFLLAFAVWALLTAGRPDSGFSRSRLFLAGFVCAMAPFAKPQVAPMTAAIGIAAAALPWLQPLLPWRRALAIIWTWFGAGVIALILLMAAYLTAAGAWPDFVNSYILDNLRFVDARNLPWSRSPEMFVYLGSTSGQFDRYFYPLLFLGCFGLFGVDWRNERARELTVVSILLFAATLYAVMAPGRPHHHYLQLLVAPLALFFGATAGSTIERLNRWQANSRLRAETRIVFLAAFLLPVLVFQWKGAAPVNSYHGQLASHGSMMQRPSFASWIEHYAERGEAMAMWGWMPWYYAELGLIQATKEAHTERQLQAWADREKYRHRYLADLRESQPPLFIDAVGEGNFAFADRERYGHEAFPELAAYIRTRYHLIVDADGSRVYLRNDRAPLALDFK